MQQNWRFGVCQRLPPTSLHHFEQRDEVQQEQEQEHKTSSYIAVSVQHDDTIGRCDTTVPCTTFMDAILDSPSNVSTGDLWSSWSKRDRIANLTDRGIPDLQDGMVARMQRVRAGSVLDGLSNVYLIGEKYVQANAYTDGSDPGDSSVLYAGYSASNVRWGSEPPSQDKANESHVNAFGSAHSGIWNVAFGDGSVRSINYNINPETHKNLSAKTPLNPGEVLADF